MILTFHSVEGFTYSEVFLCFGITLMEYSLAEAFVRGFDVFSFLVCKGEFDRILVRPRNEIFQVLASRMELTRVGRMLQAVVMFVYGIAASQVAWNWKKGAAVLFMLIGGTLVLAGIFLLYAALCYILDRDSRWWYLFLPLLAPVFLIPCYGLWRFGVHRYQSSGS